ncbi:MAG: polysaccharide biosynthesis protein [Oscillospiraceae bacterium]|nr:polysaccharide biosynthesis protein [Oscillospiraceae bacterium]
MTANKRKNQSLLNGALILSLATLIVKVIGVIYKIPLSNMIGTVGRGYFDSAYNLYIPIYTISMAGLPVAISKMVSQQMAMGHYRDVRLIHRVAKRLFFIMGIIGTLAMLILAYPYALSAKNMNVLPAIFVITPSIFFCCIMSSYRGYYNGLRNMNPTAFSQVFEAGGKLVFGLICARMVINYGYSRFEAGLTVFGKEVADETEALSAIYPYAAAAAAAGVTLGTVIGMIYLLILYKIKGDRITKTELASSPRPQKSGVVAKNLIVFAIPVVASSLVFSITNLIDAVTIQNRLEHMIVNNMDYIRNLYSTQLAGVLDADVKNFLYGAYSLSLDFKNLIPSITMTLGVSAIPALSAAWAVKNKRQIKVSIESVLRVTMMVAMPCGIGMGVLAQPILTAFYGSGNSAAGISIAAPVMAAYGFTVFLMSLSQPMTNMLQALDKAKIPLISLSIGALAKLIANYILVAIPSINVNGAVIGTILCYAIIVLINLFALIFTAKIRINFLSVFIKPVFCGILCGVAAYTSFGLCNRFIPEFVLAGHSMKLIFALGISIAMGGTVYLISMLLIKGIAKDDVLMLPKGEKIAKILAKYGFIE